MTIVPALLSDSLETLQSQVDRVKKETTLKRIQIDIVDPEFADTITIMPIDVPELQLYDFAIDIHLMTNDPINDVLESSQIPKIHTIIGQIEHMTSQKDFAEHVQSYGIAVGYSLDLYTPVESLDKFSLESASVIQLMGIQAGEQGRVFDSEVFIQKLRYLAYEKKNNGYRFELCVDGGIQPDSARLCQEAGAEMLVAGSYLWHSDNLADAVEALL